MRVLCWFHGFLSIFKNLGGIASFTQRGATRPSELNYFFDSHIKMLFALILGLKLVTSLSSKPTISSASPRMWDFFEVTLKFRESFDIGRRKSTTSTEKHRRCIRNDVRSKCASHLLGKIIIDEESSLLDLCV